MSHSYSNRVSPLVVIIHTNRHLLCQTTAEVLISHPNAVVDDACLEHIHRSRGNAIRRLAGERELTVVAGTVKVTIARAILDRATEVRTNRAEGHSSEFSFFRSHTVPMRSDGYTFHASTRSATTVTRIGVPSSGTAAGLMPSAVNPSPVLLLVALSFSPQRIGEKHAGDRCGEKPRKQRDEKRHRTSHKAASRNVIQFRVVVHRAVLVICDHTRLTGHPSSSPRGLLRALSVALASSVASINAPAAALCPPPPNCSASALQSTSTAAAETQLESALGLFDEDHGHFGPGNAERQVDHVFGVGRQALRLAR